MIQEGGTLYFPVVEHAELFCQGGSLECSVVDHDDSDCMNLVSCLKCWELPVCMESASQLLVGYEEAVG